MIILPKCAHCHKWHPYPDTECSHSPFVRNMINETMRTVRASTPIERKIAKAIYLRLKTGNESSKKRLNRLLVNKHSQLQAG